MLKDRRALLEQDIRELTKECGGLYMKAVMQNREDLYDYYNISITKLSDLKTELFVINHMIEDEHK